jgi:hypothetical protein
VFATIGSTSNKRAQAEKKDAVVNNSNAQWKNVAVGRDMMIGIPESGCKKFAQKKDFFSFFSLLQDGCLRIDL